MNASDLLKATGTARPNFAAYCDEVARLREAARRLARKGAPYVKSRGSFLTAGRANGEPVVTTADAYGWDGTRRALVAFVDDVAAKGATSVEIEGGFDSSDLHEWLFDPSYDYLPWASSWTVTVWEAATGWIQQPRGDAEAQ